MDSQKDGNSIYLLLPESHLNLESQIKTGILKWLSSDLVGTTKLKNPEINLVPIKDNQKIAAFNSSYQNIIASNNYFVVLPYTQNFLNDYQLSTNFGFSQSSYDNTNNDVETELNKYNVRKYINSTTYVSDSVNSQIQIEIVETSIFSIGIFLAIFLAIFTFPTWAFIFTIT
ncbi:MAG: hypothetical protein LBP35_02910 [Candidatus Ancillula trichonymphae]|nr:hypothetical protein [Candidatus Ancillula trichonymphae]